MHDTKIKIKTLVDATPGRFMALLAIAGYFLDKLGRRPLLDMYTKAMKDTVVEVVRVVEPGDEIDTATTYLEADCTLTTITAINDSIEKAFAFIPKLDSEIVTPGQVDPRVRALATIGLADPIAEYLHGVALKNVRALERDLQQGRNFNPTVRRELKRKIRIECTKIASLRRHFPRLDPEGDTGTGARVPVGPERPSGSAAAVVPAPA